MLLPVVLISVICSSFPMMADRSEEGWTPLHHAASDNDSDRIRALLADGADINAQCKLGGTPLWIAASIGAVGAAETLITEGADVNSGSNGSMPIVYAARNGHTAIAILLISRGAYIHGERNHGYSMLHGAAWGGSVDCARQALDKGVDINSTNIIGQTPLYLAAAGGHTELVAFLLNSGADSAIACDVDQHPRPIDIARIRGYTKIVNLIEFNIEAKANKSSQINALPAERRKPMNSLTLNPIPACAPGRA